MPRRRRSRTDSESGAVTEQSHALHASGRLDAAVVGVLAPGRDGMRDEAHLRANLVRALATLEERSVDAILAEMAEGRADAA